jgi:hypothetical protein
MRQAYFVSPSIDHEKLRGLPVTLTPIETDGAFFFEQVREHLKDKIGIIGEESFDCCDELLIVVREQHDRTVQAWIKRRHPLLPFVLSYQDGLIHALQRIARKRNTGEYHSKDHVHRLVHGYEHKYSAYRKKHDHWNASYARGYQNGLLYLIVRDEDANLPIPPAFEVPLKDQFGSLSAISRVPAKRIPRRVMQQFERIPRRDTRTNQPLIPHHTPYL